MFQRIHNLVKGSPDGLNILVKRILFYLIGVIFMGLGVSIILESNIGASP